ncbi:isopentenyl phosphate kinase-like isoform X1 [Salvia hispanica]|uniref:isopentenyl phosphate kinase-like isoform X1 n=2 Tax=Salvia hispanica TaxID=49212 RepID=UPI002009591B|nr:isopentenyl phosphate kinase-like isoform X1 [Salvia hispanica]XP_047954998.1 isopentenyl phosphate kinase-like isoform X1 [Salvia hispanica]
MDQRSQSTTTNSAADARSLHCIVKLGGSAITCKNELETINEDNLSIVSSQLRQGMISEPCHGMDWSRRPGSTNIQTVVDKFDDELESSQCKRLIVVHGAGSFGHFQASRSGVHKGGLNKPLVKAGFVATRISVNTLNLEIVRALAKEGIPSIGMSPFSCGWSTCERNIAMADTSTVVKALDAGFVPVLHGDAVLDTSLGCTILSGDVIISHLAEHLRPDYVVFLTDVSGVYDRPPTEPGAVLLREIVVHEDGSWSVLQPKLQDEVEITVAAHDTTGGMVTKITEAAMIAKLGIDVYIVKAATEHSARALKGPLPHNIPDDWLGTVIRLAH